ncbi:MAG: F0F1 ATP synthase subunit B [Deltaproteobacteria bacterium]|nr:F0F1 ATP synthase subunit B [Deltaproteobacteria bacterium]
MFGLSALFFLFAGVVFAAGGGEDGGSSKLWNLFWRFLNFVLVVGIIWKLVGKRIGEFFSGRRYQIEADLKDLDSRRTEAESKLRQVETSIANLEKERAQILQEAREQGEAMKAAIVEKAEGMAKQILVQAENSAAQEARLAIEAVKSELSDQIVEAAEKMIAAKLGNVKEQEKLVNDYLTRVVLN